MGQAGLPYPLMSKSLARRYIYNGGVCVGSAEMQGWREEMEDEIHIRPELNIERPEVSVFGVYDGHNGTYASAFLRKNMGHALADLKDVHNEKEITQVFENLDARFSDPKSAYHSESGSTAVVAIVEQLNLGRTPRRKSRSHHRPTKSANQAGKKDGDSRGLKAAKGENHNSWSPKMNERGREQPADKDADTGKNKETKLSVENILLADQGSQETPNKKFKITIANVGDSKALLIRPSERKVFELSIDHKPDRYSEMQRVAEAGGIVIRGRVNGDLAVSRAFGDVRHKKNTELPLNGQIVIATPEFQKHFAKEGDVLLLACDGVFERLSPQQVGEYVIDEIDSRGDQAPELIAARLIDYSLYKGSRDNMSCLIACFRESQEPVHLKPVMKYLGGRYLEWKDHEKFEKAYHAYAYSCGVVGKKIWRLAPAISPYLTAMNSSKFLGPENPFGIVMLIMDYVEDTQEHLALIEASKGFVTSRRNHVDENPLRVGACCVIH
mmetsp:Transcript_24406/g.58857  ORF Transcript_24406/g.58857 Transcript_24406/m.58857 type:complete len:497 (+) Transcript_24406:252-1742(+)|eukprot:CAMPEP_0114527796 /NCGR_PEP_ID=MMETSP0109-20121206/23826_1 /TAXON_ID=29199 /ORGANISM="Chlorarachnion reptans, Strain CCCM449" /LENGTH=496 /DNA_ID=CAMNT_0001709823 /DNA_START=175 /DNA_END=1665 /DNA_ORIENTATION=-